MGELPDTRAPDDEQTLRRLGYAQELARRMSGFSNYAFSLSIICILAGGITSFHQGYCAAGGASVGLGWPAVCLFSLVVAATMGQIASAFPTAGGLYHWASLLGGRGWGWLTAWLNLLGLLFVLAAINVGTYVFTLGAAEFVPADHGLDPFLLQLGCLAAITASQALCNHRGIRVTTLLTDFSGYWILFVAVALTLALLFAAPRLELGRLLAFTNHGGLPEGDTPVWPATESVGWLFLLGLLLPAYTLTGFDASAHAAEETVGAASNVPRGILRSVAVSGLFGWVMVCALVLAIPDTDTAARQGGNVFFWTLRQVLPGWLCTTLFAGIALAQYLCGLAALTSTSRMTFAFARDGGLPFSGLLRRVGPTTRAPAAAVWTVAGVSVLLTIYAPFYDTIAAAAAMLLYLSYVLPTALGCVAHGRHWTRMGPWHLGRFFRPLAVVSVAGTGLLLVIGVQPPNDKNVIILGATLAGLALLWFGLERRRFRGPPILALTEEGNDVRKAP